MKVESSRTPPQLTGATSKKCVSVELLWTLWSVTIVRRVEREPGYSGNDVTAPDRVRCWGASVPAQWASALGDRVSSGSPEK